MIRRTLTGAIDEKLKFEEGNVQRTLMVSVVLIHLSSVPTTSETMQLSWGVDTESALGTVLLSLDPSEDSETDIAFYFSEAFPVQHDEYFRLEYPNTDNVTIGVTVKGVYI